MFLPSSIILDLFGPRVAAVGGAIITTIGLAASALVKNIYLYFFTYSIIVGTGVAFLTEATFSIIPHYFNKRIGIAYGIMNLGGSCIVIAFAAVSSKMLHAIGVNYTFLVLAGFCLPAVFLCLLYKPRLPSDNIPLNRVNISAKIKESFGIRVLKKPRFLLWSIASAIGFFGFTIPVVTIVSLLH